MEKYIIFLIIIFNCTLLQAAENKINDEYTGTIDYEIFIAELEKLAPSYSALNTDTNFIKWLKVIEPGNTKSRLDFLREYEANRDAKNAAKIFNNYEEYKLENGQNNKPIYLTCRTESGSLDFIVDLKNNLLSGLPANITPTAISQNRDGSLVTISRMSGDITLILYGKCINGTDCIYNGKCRQQEGKIF
jgi:hypothetical protein